MSSTVRTTTVIRDGFHNGFTDLQEWQSLYWVSYRKGSGHMTFDGQAVLSVSTDRRRFREAARIKLPGDNRDPKLFAMSPDKLAMTIPTWEGEHKANKLNQYITFSNDGFNWEKPQRILKTGQWLWRIREHNNLYYGLVECLKNLSSGPLDHQLELMTSTDLLNWKHLANVGPADWRLNESDIHFQPDGSAWLVARAQGLGGHSVFGKAQQPYDKWETQSLGVMIHAPIILDHNNQLYVAGRSAPESEGIVGFPSNHSLGIWKLNEASVQPTLRIPATGDCSYPGLIKDSQGNICLTYYSQHAYDLGVIETGLPDDTSKMHKPADVYLAELDLC